MSRPPDLLGVWPAWLFSWEHEGGRAAGRASGLLLSFLCFLVVGQTPHTETLALKQSVVSLASLEIELPSSSPLRASKIEQERNFRQYFSKRHLATCRSRLLFSNFHFTELFAERGVTFKFVLIPLETHVWGLPGGWISADRVEDKRETCHFCVSFQEGRKLGGRR